MSLSMESNCRVTRQVAINCWNAFTDGDTFIEPGENKFYETDPLPELSFTNDGSAPISSMNLVLPRLAVSKQVVMPLIQKVALFFHVSVNLIHFQSRLLVYSSYTNVNLYIRTVRCVVFGTVSARTPDGFCTEVRRRFSILFLYPLFTVSLTKKCAGFFVAVKPWSCLARMSRASGTFCQSCSAFLGSVD